MSERKKLDRAKLLAGAGRLTEDAGWGGPMDAALRDKALIAETGPYSRDWNETEFIAKQIARHEDRCWDDLPNVSTLWFKDKMHYRHVASAALAAKRLWDAAQTYKQATQEAETK